VEILFAMATISSLSKVSRGLRTGRVEPLSKAPRFQRVWEAAWERESPVAMAEAPNQGARASQVMRMNLLKSEGSSPSALPAVASWYSANGTKTRVLFPP
jgi:hypothetical protein